MPSPGALVRGAHPYLSRALALTRRAEALGARLVAWGATTIAFAWDLDSVEELILLATGLADESAPPEAQWTCGIAEGDLEPLGRSHLAWGEPLLRAMSLSRVAHAGEVLIDVGVTALRTGELATAGLRKGKDVGGSAEGGTPQWQVEQETTGAKLDLNSPWSRSRRDVPSAPESEDPDEFAARMVEAGRAALVSGNAVSLQRLSEGLRATGEHDALADRMRAMARLSRGQIEDAIRALRQSRVVAMNEPAGIQCQASLALAFALATAGQPDDALLEGLDALARSREANDSRAQAACLAFLAKLFARVGAAGGAMKIGQKLAALGRRPSLTGI
jgi:hypothetical protein